MVPEVNSFFDNSSPQKQDVFAYFMKLLHQVKSQLKEKLDELPTQEELQKKADNFIAQLPNYKVRTSSHEP